MHSETAKNIIESVILKSLKSLKISPSLGRVEITVPDPRFGDYSTNIAMQIAKEQKANPKDLAEKILREIQKIQSNSKEDIFEKVSAAGGFINFVLSKKFLSEIVLEFTNKIEIDQIGKGQKALFEYSSPNTNKPLHIGHTRNDVYGLACIRLLKAVGFKVVSCEIINDRGIHIMKSILMYMKNGEGKTPETEKMKPDHFVGKFYTMFAQEGAKSPQAEKQLMEEAQELLQKWEKGDKEVRAVWKKMNGWFFEGVKQTYEKEGSYFDEVDFESDIYDKGRNIILQGVKDGIFIKEEDGSVSVDLTSEGLDKKTLLRKDGTTLYITQDVYLWNLRNQKYNPKIAIVTTSAEQSYHFKVLKRIFELLKYTWAENFRHLPYEHVYLGKDKMSSREGNAISADELFVLIKDKVKSIMENLEKIKQSSANDKLVEQVALGAIKYGYLKYEPNTRIYFDPDQTIALQGNTGPYLQYAFSRISSIIKKAKKFEIMAPIELSSNEEESVMRHLIHYPEKVLSAATEYKPNLLANYLFELASVFNNLYNTVPVLAAENEPIRNQRLTLLSATANILSHGLSLLGIEAPEEM